MLILVDLWLLPLTFLLHLIDIAPEIDFGD